MVVDPAYKKNPETSINMVERLADRFKNTGLVMPPTQRTMYEKIRDTFVVNDKASVKKTVCDVGCGLGIGVNILAKEARFVWGVDRGEDSISFATQMFGADPRVRFDAYDVRHIDREVSKFDVITCIEVIEHVEDPDEVVKFIKKLMGPLGKSVAWISLPNRNSPLLQKDTPRNQHHVFEPTAQELYAYLTTQFRYVVQFSSDLEETVDLDTEKTPLLLKCEEPL